MRPFSSLVAITLTSAVLLPVTQCNISNLNDEPGHPRPQRAESEIIQGDDNRSIAGPEAATPAVFDSCLIACYSDIALRFGEEFAKRLKSEGFIFETCPNDDEDVAEAVEGGEATVQRRAQLHHHEHDHDHVHHDHSHSHSHSHDHSPQQRALHRILGATNQLSRLWTSTSYSGPVRNTTTGLLQIPYAIKTTVPSDIFTPETYSTIQMALDHIEQQTGVLKFVPRENFEAEYIFFTYEDTAPYNNVCAANVGKQTNSKTTIYMGWCRQEKHLGSIIHEILHALGFWHEHSRPDRDAHITIHWDVVRSGAESAFEKALDVDSIGSPYDFKSIMHYPYNGFVDSTKGDATISPINALGPDVGMGQRVRLSENDVQQLRLLYQCSSGVRNANDVGITNLCSVDCKCWEYALGECSSDDECMGDLICGDTPSDYQEIRNANYRVDELPYYPYATGTFSCDVYCHTACCDAFRFPSAILKCPETCGSEPPVLTFETLPTKMCIQKDGSGPTTKTGSTVISSTTTTTTTTKSSVTTAATTVATTAATTTTTKATTTTTTTTSNNADWYMNWRIDSGRCVQDCIGSAPCIDRRRQSWEIPYPSVQSCCDTVKSWKPFEACAYLPVSPAPTNKPTPQPSRNPTKAPQPTNPPTSNPTSMPSRKPTPAPSHNPTPAPTSGPTQKPTPAPSAKPTPGPTSPPSQKPSPGPSAAPSHKPTPVPTHKPTPAPSSPPSHKPTPAPIAPTRKPTRMPTSVPTRQPTRRPTKQPTKNPTQKPVSSGNNGWYPDMVSNTNKCLNDGNPPSWLSYSYTSQSSCCTSHFNWAYNDCMGVEPQASNKWYVDWTRGKCVKECKTSEGGSCGGMAPGSWIVLHSTAEMCCAAHMSYVQPVSLCIYGG